MYTIEIIIKNWFKKNRITFLASIITGLIAYVYMFTNKLPNWDEFSALFYKGTTITSGRWGLEYIDIILPNYSMPWLWGILSLVFVAFTCCLVVEIFQIRSNILCILLASVISCFPSLTSTFSYMFTSSSDMIALFLSVFAVYAWEKKSSYYRGMAIIALVLSLSIYQTYLAITSSLFIIILIQQIVFGGGAN